MEYMKHFLETFGLWTGLGHLFHFAGKYQQTLLFKPVVTKSQHNSCHLVVLDFGCGSETIESLKRNGCLYSPQTCRISKTYLRSAEVCQSHCLKAIKVDKYLTLEISSYSLCRMNWDNVRLKIHWKMLVYFFGLQQQVEFSFLSCTSLWKFPYTRNNWNIYIVSSRRPTP